MFYMSFLVSEESRRALKRSLKSFWYKYKRSKMGMTGLIILAFFVFIAIFSPYISPYDPSRYNKVGPYYAQPEWASYFDPDPILPGQIIPDPYFENESSWYYGAYTAGFDKNITVGISNSVSYDERGGSLEATINDTSTTSNVGTKANRPVIWAAAKIYWPHNTYPLEVKLRFALRVEITGFQFTTIENAFVGNVSFYPANENKVADTGVSGIRTTRDFTLQKSNGTQWVIYEFAFTRTVIRRVFDERGVITLNISFIFNPGRITTDTGVIKLWLDNVELSVYGHYFGLMGTSDKGADLFSQFVWGSRVSLLVGILATLLAVVVGVVVGLVSGYFGGLLDEVLMRIVDFILIIPGLPLLLALAAVLRPSFWNIIIVIAILGWAGTARLIRSQVLSERAKAYVEAARASGASDLYIIFRHILPNVTPLLFAQIATGVSGAILSEAGLSFLGLGDPYAISWGRMLQDAELSGAFARGAWWAVIFPGLGIALLSISFVFIGYALDQILNPRLKER